MTSDVGLDNRTPFAADMHAQMTSDGQELLIALFSASFSAPNEMESLAPSPKQLAVALADVPFGDPSLSSTRYEADVAPEKPLAEVIVNGTAYAPSGKPVREMQVGIRYGSIRKVLQVAGDRAFVAGGYSEAAPFITMPIVYERAYGGTTAEGQVDQRNPVGVGYRQARSADPKVLTQAPNISYPNEQIQASGGQLRPAGFGSVGRGWLPRLGFAGTYDDAWVQNQWPLPPADFDSRHHLSAPADQHLDRIVAQQPVSLIGMTPTGRWEFRVPEVLAPIRLVYDDRVEMHPFLPDTLLIEPDVFRVTLKARLPIRLRRAPPFLREIVFGNVTPAFLVAKRKRKIYRNLTGGDGALPDRPTWRA